MIKAFDRGERGGLFINIDWKIDWIGKRFCLRFTGNCVLTFEVAELRLLAGGGILATVGPNTNFLSFNCFFFGTFFFCTSHYRLLHKFLSILKSIFFQNTFIFLHFFITSLFSLFPVLFAIFSLFFSFFLFHFYTLPPFSPSPLLLFSINLFHFNGFSDFFQ